jgi:pyruvate dehydrogenase E2 component (dihydrolipoamide acetyltransferase)
MVTKVVMPRLSLTMKEGTVGKWYKKEGETVEKGEPIVEVVSEKATYDLEAPSSGILRRVLVEAGLDVPVNATLAVITMPDEPYEEIEATSGTKETAEPEGGGRVLASPAAKRLAREHGINLSTVAGSGAEGRIAEEDVQRVIKQKAGTMPRVKQIIPLSGYKKTTAERLSKSFRTAPHSTVVMETDMSKATELHEKTQASYTAIIVKAVARALRQFPVMNSTLDGSNVMVYEDINVGVAVATENGLVVPVVHNVDGKPLREIDAAIRELGEKARLTGLSKEDLTGGTFTVTNLGMYDVDLFTPIINPPEAAILGIGKTTPRPVAVDDSVEIKPILMLSLSYDHRIVDGAPAAQFLKRVKQEIEKPADK